jgi:hypothetical protein
MGGRERGGRTCGIRDNTRQGRKRQRIVHSRNPKLASQSVVANNRSVHILVWRTWLRRPMLWLSAMIAVLYHARGMRTSVRVHVRRLFRHLKVGRSWWIHLRQRTGCLQSDRASRWGGEVGSSRVRQSICWNVVQLLRLAASAPRQAHGAGPHPASALFFSLRNKTRNTRRTEQQSCARCRQLGRWYSATTVGTFWTAREGMRMQC